MKKDVGHNTTILGRSVRLAAAVRRWPLGTYVLLAVNVPLGLMLVVLMVFEYRDEMNQAILEKEAGLADEAVAVHQTVIHLAHEHTTTSAKSIGEFIERVCAKMQNKRSPGHVIMVVRGDEILHSKAHDHAISDADAILVQAFRDGKSRIRWQQELIVLGGHEEDGTVVVIAELGTNIRQTARIDVLWQLGSLAVLAILAATIMDAVLWRLIRSPLQRLAATVDGVASGEFAAELANPVGRELQTLTQSFNFMSTTLQTNERRRQHEMERARKIQKHLLPNGIQVTGLVICREFQPAEDVAGDYYDLIPLSDGSWMIVMADVAGHGIPAAMVATILKALLLCVSEQTSAPDEILRQVNRRFMSLMPSEMFVTILLALWHPGTNRLVYVNAGHPSGLVWNPRCGFRELDSTTVPVGILDATVFQPRELELASDDRMVWFTDGLIEAISPTNEMFGKARLQEVIVRFGAMTPDRLQNAILTAVNKFVGDKEFLDDVTILVAGREVSQSQFSA